MNIISSRTLAQKILKETVCNGGCSNITSSYNTNTTIKIEIKQERMKKVSENQKDEKNCGVEDIGKKCIEE